MVPAAVEEVKKKKKKERAIRQGQGLQGRAPAAFFCAAGAAAVEELLNQPPRASDCALRMLTYADVCYGSTRQQRKC